jgi:hypothetical protein
MLVRDIAVQPNNNNRGYGDKYRKKENRPFPHDQDLALLTLIYNANDLRDAALSAQTVSLKAVSVKRQALGRGATVFKQLLQIFGRDGVNAPAARAFS